MKLLTPASFSTQYPGSPTYTYPSSQQTYPDFPAQTPFTPQGPPGMGFFFFIFTSIFVGAILFSVVSAASNAASPILTREGYIVSKRQHVSEVHDRASTTYYVTFEFVDRSRSEFRVNPQEYGLLAEGDQGTLHSQGSWYKGFERQYAAQ